MLGKEFNHLGLSAVVRLGRADTGPNRQVERDAIHHMASLLRPECWAYQKVFAVYSWVLYDRKVP